MPDNLAGVLGTGPAVEEAGYDLRRGVLFRALKRTLINYSSNRRGPAPQGEKGRSRGGLPRPRKRGGSRAWAVFGKRGRPPPSGRPGGRLRLRSRILFVALLKLLSQRGRAPSHPLDQRKASRAAG